MSVPDYTVYYDRQPGSIMGRFSIRHKSGKYVVEKLLARSGQLGQAKTSWVNGESPIPYGHYNLSTIPNNRGMDAGEKGIGECFPIDNQGDRLTIVNPDNKRQKRREIMVHAENSIPGTRGCIAIVYRSEWLKVRDWLRGCHEEGIDVLDLVVL